MTRVLGPMRRLASSSFPTRTTRSPNTAMACASGCVGLTVQILPWRSTVSAVIDGAVGWPAGRAKAVARSGIRTMTRREARLMRGSWSEANDPGIPDASRELGWLGRHPAHIDCHGQAGSREAILA